MFTNIRLLGLGVCLGTLLLTACGGSPDKADNPLQGVSSSSSSSSVSSSTSSMSSSSSSSASQSSSSSSSSSSKSSSSSSSSSSSATSAGTIGLTTNAISTSQSAASVMVTVTRSAGTSGAASVQYFVTDGSAVAGTDFVLTSGALNWASGTGGSKTFPVSLMVVAAYTGSRNFTVKLSNVTGAALGTATAVVTINGTGTVSTGSCAKNANSWTVAAGAANAFESKRYGNYFVNNNNWGQTANQQFWSNDESCWGVTTSATVDIHNVSSYPSVTRGWTQNGWILDENSSPGTKDWTTKSGMGINVAALTKAKIKWGFTAPTSTGSRWLGLMDIYFHNTNSPSDQEFPPVVDLMIDQALMDEVISGQAANLSTFYALSASYDHASTVTLGGIQYLVYVDDSGEAAYHQAGGHTIHLFQLPTTYTNSTGALWGTMADTRHDLKAIIDYFRQMNPKDDAGNSLKFATGSNITTALIADNLYLNAINAGWEIDVGTVFTNTAFCVSMQSEADCP